MPAARHGSWRRSGPGPVPPACLRARPARRVRRETGRSDRGPAVFLSIRGWTERTHNLSRMGLRDLVRVYLTYPAIISYLALTAASVVLVFHWGGEPWRLALAVAVALLVYPLAWYLIHRFILHGRFLYKSPVTASTWKRIHFDHH